MGWPGRMALSLLLVLAPMYLHGASLQKAGPAGQRKPFFERLHRLEEQFRRFQQVTLTHLQGIANNYNVSYDINARFQSLAEESQAVALTVNRSQATIQGDLAHLKTWVRKTQRQSRKVDMRLQALNLALSEKSRQWVQAGKEQNTQRDVISGLALDMQALQGALVRLTRQVHSQGVRLAALEGHLQMANPGTAAPGLTPAPTSAQPVQPGPPMLLRDRQVVTPSPTHGSLPQDFTVHLQGTQKPPAPRNHWAPGDASTVPRDPLQGPGEVCNLGPVFTFPDASPENVIFLSPSFLTALRALSFCSWVRTPSGHLGTLLSYATEENDNKLVLHGRESLVPGSLHFVIGDPAFRELPLQLLLDGQWHHICVIWTSVQGRYWLHVDRRLVATGSRFREGYEIPPGGSLVLGQEQDSVGGGFDSSEAFVGSMSGLAIWDRALVPGEVANLAMGKELPTGAILTLANASWVGRVVQRADCTCLELCP